MRTIEVDLEQEIKGVGRFRRRVAAVPLSEVKEAVAVDASEVTVEPVRVHRGAVAVELRNPDDSALEGLRFNVVQRDPPPGRRPHIAATGSGTRTTVPVGSHSVNAHPHALLTGALRAATIAVSGDGDGSITVIHLSVAKCEGAVLRGCRLSRTYPWPRATRVIWVTTPRACVSFGTRSTTSW